MYISETRVEKASRPVGAEEDLLVRGDGAEYASRGGHKLQKAMEAFKVDAEGLVCMDVGAAAGGFTDVLLRAGARHVYAIDVGYGQLDWRIRQDARVTVMERTNARHLVPEQFPMMPRLAVMDVSFISIRLIIPVLFSLMGKEGRLISLVKPQFEAGRGQVGKARRGAGGGHPSAGAEGHPGLCGAAGPVPCRLYLFTHHRAQRKC
ncbi:MAG: TlyA family RNA methyltransferase [Christensenellales bacterium]